MTDLTDSQTLRAAIVAEFALDPITASAAWALLHRCTLSEAHETLALAADVESPVAW